MSAVIPPLRATLTLEERPDDPKFPATLVDPDLGQRMKLDGRGVEVAQLLDRERPVEELATALDTTQEVVERVIELFGRMHLLDTESSRTFVREAQEARDFQFQNPDTVPLLIRDDARFSCTMCGSCCGGHNVGPVGEDIVEGLKPMWSELTAATGSKKGLFFSIPMQTEDGMKDQMVCHSSGGSCVFLTPQGRCRIHQDYGGHKKPRVCRLFPYQFVATPEGISVSLQMECRGFDDARGGKPLKEQEADLRQLLKLVPAMRRVRPVIVLDGLNPLTWDDYTALEDALHAAVDTHATNPIAALLEMRTLIERKRGREDHVYPGSDPATLRRDLARFYEGMHGMIGGLEERFARNDRDTLVHTETLDMLAQALDTFVPDIERVVLPLDRPKQRSLFVEAMHHHLMGKELTLARTVVTGMARLAFGWLMAKALMIARARQVKRRHFVSQDVLDAMVVVNFMLRNEGFMKTFSQADPAIISLFYERLPALVEHAPAIKPPDKRLEFYKF